MVPAMLVLEHETIVEPTENCEFDAGVQDPYGYPMDRA